MAGNFTIQNPLVKYNLYEVSPLSAVVCFETKSETPVTITVLGKTKDIKYTGYVHVPASIPCIVKGRGELKASRRAILPSRILW